MMSVDNLDTRETEDKQLHTLLHWMNEGTQIKIPIALITLTGDLRSAAFLSRCIELSAVADNYTFARPARDWEAELKFSNYVLDEMRKKLARWITTEIHHNQNNAPVTYYTINFKQLLDDLQTITGKEIIY